jgi:ferredoxin-NADP reductase
MEWTLPHVGADSRGVRRYFTIASAPEDKDIRIGVKFYSPPSTFKQALISMKKGDTIAVGNLAGDFTLPNNSQEPLVFIAGGIGITPFTSMIEHMVATRQKRPITLLYSNKTANDIAYRKLLDRAERELGIKVVYVNTDETSARIDQALIEREVPDYAHRTFYVSGPQGLVAALVDTLRSLGVARRSIKTDYFPGFA